VIVRKDIPVADQIVQVGHAAQSAAREFEYQDNTHMVVLQVPDGQALTEAMVHIERHEIKYAKFHEPDEDMGYTALCTEAITGNSRHCMRKFKLWSN
jgi:predicted transcriptional regulator YdeE